MISEGTGDLLAARVDAIVNTVNTAGAMGKGIALQFKKAFPENFRVYAQACARGEVTIGKMFIFETAQPEPRFVINFPTKKHWRNPSEIQYIREGLSDLIAQVRARGITSLAIPPLGCGLGGLNWTEVRPLIEGAFGELSDVRAVIFAPSTAPRAETMADRRGRPKMTPGRAAIVGLIRQYLMAEYQESVSLLEIQKLAYFLQVAGEPLRLAYKAHLYGPYADTLRQVLSRIEGHFTVGYGDGSAGPGGEIKLLPDAAEKAAVFLSSANETRARMERVAELIEGFETPLGMELLASTHWVMANDSEAKTQVEATVTGVKQWNSRKAKVMGAAQIRAAWERLRQHPWVFAAKNV